jgi:glycerol-3-phosphate dehydrogenase (NAD(P)+)
VADRARPTIPLPGRRNAVVVGAGSFGTAIAILLARGGMRTTLQTRTSEQAERMIAEQENGRYLPGVGLPPQLRVENADAGLKGADYVFLGVPSRGMDEVIASLDRRGLGRKAAIISLAKGLVPPEGRAPTVLLRERFGIERVGCIGGPAHAKEMVFEGAGLVAAFHNQKLAKTVAEAFIRAGVVCERSNDPVGIELAGAAKNAAALAAGATEKQGLNAAGAAAGHIFAEVWRYAESQGARPESMIGLGGTGDLVATALAPQSRNRRAGELLGQGIPTAEIPERIGQAVEALGAVPLLATALRRAGVEAPVTSALADLITGDSTLEEWVARVRTTVPPPARWQRRQLMRRLLTRFWDRIRLRIGDRRRDRPALTAGRKP